jgi:hypothetical protein
VDPSEFEPSAGRGWPTAVAFAAAGDAPSHRAARIPTSYTVVPMLRCLLVVLASGSAVAAGCGAGPSAHKSPGQPMTEEAEHVSACATPCARLHRNDRRRGDCRPQVRYTDGQGLGGRIYAHFRVSEQSKRGCSMAGYPTIRMIDMDGHALPTHVAQDHTRPVRAIHLRRGHPAGFQISYAYTLDDGLGCRPAPHALSLRLPGTPRAIRVPVDGADPDLRVFTPCHGAIVLTPMY